MAKFVPFTLHVRIVPQRGSGAIKSKRFEYVRDMQKIASKMYQSIIGISGVQVAQPGGGQHMSSNALKSGYVAGMAVKPQIGESPAQTMLTGFIEVSGQNVQNHAEVQRISGNELYEGAVPSPAENNPLSHLDATVSSLKASVENAFATDLQGIEYSIFRIDLSGVTYGDKGYHFP